MIQRLLEQWGTALLAEIPHLIEAAVIIVLTVVVDRRLQLLVARAVKRSRNQRELTRLLGRLVRIAVLVGALLVYVTSRVAHRPLTTELPLIVVWATMQLAAGITLRTAGVLRAPATSAWIVATAIATLVGLACYLVFYRLDPVPAYWIGMVPSPSTGWWRRSWPPS